MLAFLLISCTPPNLWIQAMINNVAESVFTYRFLNFYFNAKLMLFINISNSATFMLFALVFFNQAVSSEQTLLSSTFGMCHFLLIGSSLQLLDNIHHFECSVTHLVVPFYFLCLSLYLNACNPQPSSHRVVTNQFLCRLRTTAYSTYLQKVESDYPFRTPIFQSLYSSAASPSSNSESLAISPCFSYFGILPLLFAQLTHPPRCHQ